MILSDTVQMGRLKQVVLKNGVAIFPIGWEHIHKDSTKRKVGGGVYLGEAKME